MALAGVCRSTQLGLRLVLAAWIGLALGLTFGMPGLSWLYHVVPGLKRVAVYRYLDASWILSACVLAAFALDDLFATRRRWPIAVAGLAIAAALVAEALRLPNDVAALLAQPFSRGAVVVAITSFVVIALVQALPVQRRALMLTALMLCETLAWFVVPLLCYPRAGELELGSIQFLQAKLGFQRFATLGPIPPNYGAYFSLASVNHNDMPVPDSWVAYVRDHLDSDTPAVVFDGNMRLNGTGGSATEQFLHKRDAFSAIGVRYVVAPLTLQLPELPEVFRDRVVHIYALESAPYMTAPACTLDVGTRDRLVALCERASSLLRLELMMPGWRAWVNGERVHVDTVNGIFQSVALPPGRSRIVFSFLPPFMVFGYASFALGWVVLAVQSQAWRVASRAGLRRRRPVTSQVAC